MTLTKTFPTQDPGGLSITDTRRVMAGLVVKNSDGTPRTGVFPSSTSPIVTGRATMGYDVAPFFAALSRVAPGIEFVSNDAVTVVPTTAAPAANSRIDVIWVRSRFLQHVDGSNLPELGVTQGAAAAVPSKPGIPAGATELAAAEITATTTTTATAVITQTHRYTAAAGGTVLVRNVTELTAFSAADGTYARDMATGTLYERAAGAWSLLVRPWGPYAPTVSGLTLGNGVLTARYGQIGRRVEFSIGLAAGTTTAATSTVTFGLPVPSETSVPFKQFGSGTFRLGAANVYPLLARWFSTAPGEIVLNTLSTSAATLASGSNVSQLFPTGGAWAAGTTFFIEGSYEAAA